MRTLSTNRLVFMFVSSILFVSFMASGVLADVIIDNGTAGTSSAGSWQVSGGADPYGDDSLWSRDGSTYTWAFESQPAGSYEVLMWWSAWPSRSSDVNVDISYHGAIDAISIDQSVDTGQWNSLGVYNFGTSGSVTMIASNGSTVSTCADAVWFRLIAENSPPTAYIDSIIPNPADSGALITFTGHGEDPNDVIKAHNWESSISGVLSASNSFSAVLADGVHTIIYEVQDGMDFWSEAATEVLVVGSVPEEIIIDNLDAATEQTGTWSVSGGSDPYGDNSFWSRDGATFTWYFNAPEAGIYELSLWWTEWPSRSTSAPITIEHAGGTDTVYKNQQTNGGQWNVLGTYQFNGITDGTVTITAEDSAPVSYCADAVKFILSETNEPPTAYIDSIAPNPAIEGESVSFVGHGEDADGTITGCTWISNIDGLISNGFSFDDPNLSVGVHIISMTVEDNDGAMSVAATETLAIQPIVGNLIPTAYIDSITSNPATEGELVSFVGHGEDPDGTIAGCTWTSSINGFMSNDLSFGKSNLSVGVHIISMTVEDDDGAVSTAATETLIVQGVSGGDESIIDNGDSNTSSVGTWSNSSGPDPYDGSSLWSRDGSTYTWTFTPSSSGFYELSMWWTEWSSRTTAAPITIQYSGGSETVYVNQQDNGGQWNKIGEYNYEVGTSYNVVITAVSGLSSTCADAVKFVQISQPGAPEVEFAADKLRGAIPFNIQFNNQTIGSVSQWQWDFGDGQTSSQRNPSHIYTTHGLYAVTLTATSSYGTDTKIRENYIDIRANTRENIYLIDGYGGNDFFVPETEQMLRDVGAVQNGSSWIYQSSDTNLVRYIYFVHDPAETEAALYEQGSHVVIEGHANFGFGTTFASPSEIWRQQIDDIYYVDDDRFVNYSTDMVSTKVDGMKYGQAYPNWEPMFKDGTSAIMPYTFGDSRGNPPYNYYLTYTIPGDPEVYKIELADGSYLERFPDASTPVWYSADGSPPDPVLNPEYFIINTDPDYSRCDFIGDWPIVKESGGGYTGALGYLGYNYQVRWPGLGSNTATWTLYLKYPGMYVVMATWYPDSVNASNARYEISHAGGTSVVFADQRTTLLTNTLGVFNFNAGSNTIALSDNANGQVIADAMLLSSLSNPEEILQSEFKADVTSGGSPLTVQFSELSGYYNLSNPIGGVIGWLWDFGDGNSSTDKDPQHTYSSSGIYTVTLTITDGTGDQASETKSDFIVVGTAEPLEAEFTSLSRFGSDRTVVNFIDQSSGNITNWLWDFGDGQTSTEQNPIHVYTEPDSYDVTLTVSGSSSDDTEFEEDFVYNIIGLVYADNTQHTKPHFYSRSIGSPITFGKVICSTGDVKIQEEDLGYIRMFHGACNSFQYFTENFRRGVLIANTTDVTIESYGGTYYLEYYLKGYSDKEIFDYVNSIEDIHEYYNFNLKPPSMR